MAQRLTKEIKYIRLPEQRIKEIEELVRSWPYETKAFMRARLNQYRPRFTSLATLLDMVRSLFFMAKDRQFVILKDPSRLEQTRAPGSPGPRWRRESPGRVVRASPTSFGGGTSSCLAPHWVHHRETRDSSWLRGKGPNVPNLLIGSIAPKSLAVRGAAASSLLRSGKQFANRSWCSRASASRKTVAARGLGFGSALGPLRTTRLGAGAQCRRADAP